MPVINRRKPQRANGTSAISDSVADSPRDTPANARRRVEEPSDEDVVEDDEVSSVNEAEDGGRDRDTEFQEAVKRMVRFALACELRRQSIKRVDISNKVLGPNKRTFKKVFDAAQGHLQEVFGMKMEELPLRDKVTIEQRRNAQARDKVQTSSNAWILVSTLPAVFRTPEILSTGYAPTPHEEATFTGIYTFIISIITIQGGCLSEGLLTKYMAQVTGRGASGEGRELTDRSMDKLIARLIKDRYILKEKDTASSTGEDRYDYYVGPRGRVEVGPESVASVVRAVYNPQGEKEIEELEAKIKRTLGLDKGDGANERAAQAVEAEEDAAQEPQENQGRRRSKRARDANEDSYR